MISMREWQGAMTAPEMGKPSKETQGSVRGPRDSPGGGALPPGGGLCKGPVVSTGHDPFFRVTKAVLAP